MMPVIYQHHSARAGYRRRSNVADSHSRLLVGTHCRRHQVFRRSGTLKQTTLTPIGGTLSHLFRSLVCQSHKILVEGHVVRWTKLRHEYAD